MEHDWPFGCQLSVVSEAAGAQWQADRDCAQAIVYWNVCGAVNAAGRSGPANNSGMRSLPRLSRVRGSGRG